MAKSDSKNESNRTCDRLIGYRTTPPQNRATKLSLPNPKPAWPVRWDPLPIFRSEQFNRTVAVVPHIFQPLANLVQRNNAPSGQNPYSLYKKFVKSSTCVVSVNLVKYETHTKQKSPAATCPEVILLAVLSWEIPTGLGGYVVSPSFFGLIDVTCSNALNELDSFLLTFFGRCG